MGTISIIGLGNFACRIIDELYNLEGIEVLAIDKNRSIVERYRDKVKDAQIVDVYNFDSLKKILPEDTTHAIVDLGHDNVEAAILVTNYLHKLKIPNIIVKAQGDTNKEILEIVGATQVVLPDFDAAQKITQLLVSSSIYDFLQVSSLFSMAIVSVKKEDSGKTLASCEFRKKYRLNVIGYRSQEGEELSPVRSADFALIVGQQLLVAGTEADITEYIGTNVEAASVISNIRKESFKDKVKRFSFFQKNK